MHKYICFKIFSGNLSLNLLDFFVRLSFFCFSVIATSFLVNNGEYINNILPRFRGENYTMPVTLRYDVASVG